MIIENSTTPVEQKKHEAEPDSAVNLAGAIKETLAPSTYIELYDLAAANLPENYLPEVWMFDYDLGKAAAHHTRIVTQISRLDKATFGEDMYWKIPTVDAKLFDPNATVVLLRDTTTKEVVGYSYAIPTEEMYSSNKSLKHRTPDPTTAYIQRTVIHEKYRGQHRVGPMMECMKEALRQKGFTHIERDARIDNNYADNIAIIEAENIEASFRHQAFGDQTFFRIKL